MGKITITIEYEDPKPHAAGKHGPVPNISLPNFKQGQPMQIDPRLLGQILPQVAQAFGNVQLPQGPKKTDEMPKEE